MFYVFLCKNILPKIGQNPKLSKRIAELYNLSTAKGLRDISLPSHIYKPSKIVLHLIYKEIIRLICLNRFLKILTFSYISSPN